MLFESGRGGVAAVRLARELAAEGEATVTAVAIAPQAPAMRGCGPSAHDYNAAVRDNVAKELEQVEEMLWEIGPRAECRMLVEGMDPPLDRFAANGGFDLVLLPGHRRLLRAAGHPAFGRLSAVAGAEILVVDPSAAA